MEKIIISGIKIFAQHGCLKEEGKIGTYYIVDVSIKTDIKKAAETDELQDTVNYTEVVETIIKITKQKKRLIETVANNIATKLIQEFKKIKSVEVSLTKTSPPVKGEVKSVGVIVSKNK